MIAGYKIGNLNISPGLVLSPMSGVTTRPFRRLLRALNPGAIGLLMSEFISVEAMTRKVPRSLDMMRFHEEERPYVIQIFGYDISRMADAAMMVQDAGADGVDINCGCPAPKVVRKGGGCELMRQPEHLGQILREVKRRVKIPLTVKIRSGWDQNSRNAIEVAKIVEAEGADGLAIHGRTRTQMYRGEADWELVHEVAQVVDIPVFGSGDIINRESALKRLSYGAKFGNHKTLAGLFIGRGAISNPFIFSEIMSGKGIKLRDNPVLALAVLQRYVQLLEEDFLPKVSIGKLKQLASQMCGGLEWRKDLLRANSFEDQKGMIASLQDQLGYTSPITFAENYA